MTQREAKPPRHLCVVLLSGLGDVVHGLPVVNALKDATPLVKVTWVVEPMPSGLLAGHPSIDRVIVYRRSDGIRGLRQLRRDLRSGEPIDTTINFNVYLKSVWPTLLSRAERRIGFDRARSFEGVWLAATERLPANPRAHTADMFLEFAHYLGVTVSHPEWRLRFSPDETSAQSRFFEGFSGKPVATVIPASATHKKDWLPDRWAQVIDALASDFGFRVVIAGGPGEREQRIAREIISATSSPVELAMGDSVRRLAWIVGGSDLVLAPDTGPVHIARAFGVPVIGVYGHTNPWRVGPWRAFEDLWVDHYTDPAIGPDASNRKPKWDVMPTIVAEEVIAKVETAVERYGPARARRG
jgi:heptosyltransferase I